MTKSWPTFSRTVMCASVRSTQRLSVLCRGGFFLTAAPGPGPAHATSTAPAMIISGSFSRIGAVRLPSQAFVPHRPPVGDGDRVELEVQLVREVERHLLRPLRLDDALVLVEDDVLEVAQDVVGLVEVVVPTDSQEPPALVLTDRLGREEVQHPLLPAPAEAQHDGVGKVQLVAAAALRLLLLLVREHGEVGRVRRLGPDDLVVEDMLLGPHLVRGDDRPLRVAEESWMDEGEVAEVGEVLHLAR